MKNKTLLISGLGLFTLWLLLSSGIMVKTPSDNARTEEYAIVDVIQSGKRKFIRITKGSAPASEIEWKKEKTDDKDDFTPVINALNQLNEEGFKLLNVSLAYTTMSGSSFIINGDPRHTFMMVKQLK